MLEGEQSSYELNLHLLCIFLTAYSNIISMYMLLQAGGMASCRNSSFLVFIYSGHCKSIVETYLVQCRAILEGGSIVSIFVCTLFV